MKNKPIISVIIPVERETDYLKEVLYFYSKQTYQNFEVIIASSLKFPVSYPFVRLVVNKKLSGDVASKRNEILKFGKGEIFVFNDDDVFTPKNYLENVIKKLKSSQVIAACGPLLTPPRDSFLQRASGAVWESYLGSVGAGVYRSRKMALRPVFDYPAANLIIRRQVFQAIGGFEKGLFPGEDTKLCLLIFNKYQKGISYDPRLFVYHHRKPLFKAHLRQIGRYGKQRGWFALSYPETSFKIQYFFPSIFFLYILFLPLLLFFEVIFILPLIIYSLFVIIEGALISFRGGVKIGFAASLGIIATHLYYGWRFLKSFLGKIWQKIGENIKLSRRI